MNKLDIIHVKLRNITNHLLGPIRRQRLKNTPFTIISNNCWGAHCYRYYRLPFDTPTIGLYIFSPDFIRMVQNLEHYMSLPLQFISCDESKYRDILRSRGEQDVPIGLLGDVEIVFLHYQSREEALEKWQRRVKRIHWDNLYFKFAEMNECSDQLLQAFDALPYKNKFAFTVQERPEIKCAIHFPGYEQKGYITDDITSFRHGLNLRRFANGCLWKEKGS